MYAAPLHCLLVEHNPSQWKRYCAVVSEILYVRLPACAKSLCQGSATTAGWITRCLQCLITWRGQQLPPRLVIGLLWKFLLQALFLIWHKNQEWTVAAVH
jgi:prepilin signal peptidase PulO-like enzyme (type II secretory pathway)